MINGRKKAMALAVLFAIVLCFPSSGNNGICLVLNRCRDQNAYACEAIEETACENDKLYVGGFQIGFTLNVKGAVISGFNEVDTAGGYAKLRCELECGDVIKYVNGREINKAEDVAEALSTQIEPSTLIIVSRYGKMITSYVDPLIERVSGALRLGLSVRDEIGGIGTVTYITQDGYFGALGHSAAGVLADEDIDGGAVYRCRIGGVEKGKKGSAGSVIGAIDRSEQIGTVDKNTHFGVYGRLNEWDGELMEKLDREEIKPGSATVRCGLFESYADYSVEIVKVAYQPNFDEKGLVIRITDKKLLSLSGGIIQGMSGSPIIKDGRIVGAVTHVFINDPTRGYGIYIDSMLAQTQS